VSSARQPQPARRSAQAQITLTGAAYRKPSTTSGPDSSRWSVAPAQQPVPRVISRVQRGPHPWSGTGGGFTTTPRPTVWGRNQLALQAAGVIAPRHAPDQQWAIRAPRSSSRWRTRSATRTSPGVPFQLWTRKFAKNVDGGLRDRQQSCQLHALGTVSRNALKPAAEPRFACG
jgi:hypothetical protein